MLGGVQALRNVYDKKMKEREAERAKRKLRSSTSA